MGLQRVGHDWATFTFTFFKDLQEAALTYSHCLLSCLLTFCARLLWFPFKVFSNMRCSFLPPAILYVSIPIFACLTATPLSGIRPKSLWGRFWKRPSHPWLESSWSLSSPCPTFSFMVYIVAYNYMWHFYASIWLMYISSTKASFL